MTRAEREELKALSLELFGVSSKWKSFLELGTRKVLSRTVTETVPGENGEPDTTRDVKMPILSASGAKQYVIVLPTVTELRSLLSDLKRQNDELKAKLSKLELNLKTQKEQEALVSQVQKAGGGSAL